MKKRNIEINEAFNAIDKIEIISNKFINKIDFDKLEQSNREILNIQNEIKKIVFTSEEILFINKLNTMTRKSIHEMIFEDTISFWNKKIESDFGMSRYDIFKTNCFPPSLQNYPRWIFENETIIEIKNDFTKSFKIYKFKFAYELYEIENKKFQGYQYMINEEIEITGGI